MHLLTIKSHHGRFQAIFVNVPTTPSEPTTLALPSVSIPNPEAIPNAITDNHHSIKAILMTTTHDTRDTSTDHMSTNNNNNNK